MYPKHLISEKGILVNFTVAKKIPSKKIESLQNKVKKTLKEGDDLEELLKKEISKQTQKTLNVNDIPGIIVNNHKKNDLEYSNGIFADESRVMLLNFFGMNLAKKMINQKFKKDEICFIMLTILGTLGLTDQDFKDFHKNNRQNMDDDDYNDEDDDYDDEY
jgi:hypothetical protein